MNFAVGIMVPHSNYKEMLDRINIILRWVTQSLYTTNTIFKHGISGCPTPKPFPFVPSLAS